jgi:hypothetical protein
MATRILVKPIQDYFVAFLSTRGINVTADNPEVIHYFGSSQKELKKLVAEHDPDLVIIHDPKAMDIDFKFPYAMDDVKCDRDIYVPRQIITNAPDLARLHYQSLGLERTVHDVNAGKEFERKEKLKINASAVKKVFSAMMWD